MFRSYLRLPNVLYKKVLPKIVAYTSAPKSKTKIQNICSFLVLAEILPKPTDVNDVMIKYKAATYSFAWNSFL